MSKSSEEVKEAFKCIFSSIGLPVILHTDNGKEFGNSLMEHLCEKHGINFVHEGLDVHGVGSSWKA